MKNSYSFLEGSITVRKSYNGFIMIEDLPVVKIVNSEAEIIDSRAPLYFHVHKDFEKWCESRCVDLTRKSPRVFKKMLKLNTSNEVDIVLSVYARTITDRYWFKPANSNKTFADVELLSSELNESAIDGKFIELDDRVVMTPELTNIGSFEKCWIKSNGDWYLVKKGNRDELFSEYLIGILCCSLNLSAVMYSIFVTKDRIVSKDFTNFGEMTYEPMSSITESEDHIDNINLLTQLTDDSTLVKQYMNIIFMDTICFNVDRHLDNYGFLRDLKTGEILSMAPNYDNNLSLISRERRANCITPKLLIGLFIKAKKYCNYEIPEMDFSKLEELIETAKLFSGSDVEVSYVLNFIRNSYNSIVKGE